jgi:hypothetical protein
MQRPHTRLRLYFGLSNSNKGYSGRLGAQPMKCAFCGNTRFGLIHYQLITFNGVLRFCKKSCKDGHQKKVIEEVKRRKFVKFLFEETGRR